MPESTYKKPAADVNAVRPMITVILLLLGLWSLYQSSSLKTPWLWHHAFLNIEFGGQWDRHNYLAVAEMMLSPTFAHINIWQFLGDSYFLWVFGSAVEQKLGQWRYLLLILLCLFGGWLMLGFETIETSSLYFLGSSVLTCGIIGAYVNFYPEKKINPAGTLGRGYRIYHNERDPDPAASFGVSAWVIIALFAAYQVGMHFYMTHSGCPVNFDNLRPLAAMGNLILGSAVCYTLVVMATSHLQGDPLRRLVLQRYQQLKALDLTNEQCIEGTARLLSLPVDQVKDWISKGTLPSELKR